MRKTLIAAAFLASTLVALPGYAADVASGTFVGASNHVTTGGVEVYKDGDSYVVKLGSDFNFDGAPDPKVGFGKGGTYVGGTLIGVLESNTGEQVYKVPASLDITDFTDVFIWCEQYSVPLGYATIK